MPDIGQPYYLFHLYHQIRSDIYITHQKQETLDKTQSFTPDEKAIPDPCIPDCCPDLSPSPEP